MKVNVLSIVEEGDKSQIYKLWESTLGNIWPIDKQVFNEIIFSQFSDNFAVKDSSKIIAFLSTQAVQETASKEGC